MNAVDFYLNKILKFCTHTHRQLSSRIGGSVWVRCSLDTRKILRHEGGLFCKKNHGCFVSYLINLCTKPGFILNLSTVCILDIWPQTKCKVTFVTIC